LSAYTVAQNAKIYGDGQQVDGMTSLVSVLLPATAGGLSSYLGQTKTAYPWLQAIAASGSDITSANILQKIFDHYVRVRKKGQGMPNKVIMNYTNFGHAVKAVEASKGAFNVVPGSQTASIFGWDTIKIGGFAGTIELVGVREANFSEIQFLDMSEKSMVLASNGGMRKIADPDGNLYFKVRNTTGYQFVTDTQFLGDLIVKAPCRNGILYNVPNLVA
jgi:hypothetical protein